MQALLSEAEEMSLVPSQCHSEIPPSSLDSLWLLCTALSCFFYLHIVDVLLSVELEMLSNLGIKERQMA